MIVHVCNEITMAVCFKNVSKRKKITLNL